MSSGDTAGVFDMVTGDIAVNWQRQSKTTNQQTVVIFRKLLYGKTKHYAEKGSDNRWGLKPQLVYHQNSLKLKHNFN